MTTVGSRDAQSTEWLKQLREHRGQAALAKSDLLGEAGGRAWGDPLRPIHTVYLPAALCETKSIGAPFRQSASADGEGYLYR